LGGKKSTSRDFQESRPDVAERSKPGGRTVKSATKKMGRVIALVVLLAVVLIASFYFNYPLTYRGRTVSYWAEVITHPLDWKLQQGAQVRTCLDFIGCDKQLFLEALIPVLHDPRPETAALAREAIKSIDPAAALEPGIQ
jgi:hypothetical protein